MILVCGEALMDIFVTTSPMSDKKEKDIVMKALPGGSPFNVATGLARLGRKAALSTQYGRDEFGQKLAKCLMAEKVDTSFIRIEEQSTAVAFVETDEQGTPYYAIHGLNELVYHPEKRLIKQYLEQLSAIHIGSHALVSPQSCDELLEQVSNVSEKVLISVDPNVRLQVEPNFIIWREAFERFRREAHLIKASSEDLHTMYGKDVDLYCLAKSWLSHSHIVVLTMGLDGAAVFSRRWGRINIRVSVSSVADTVGAGDSFQAAMLCWLEENGFADPVKISELSIEQIKTMGEFASQSAAITCQRKGSGAPYRNELHEFA